MIANETYFSNSIAFLLLYSCCTDNGKFLIKNNSDFDIESLSIIPDSKTQYFKIKKGDHIYINTCMNEVKSDGGYSITYKNISSGKTISNSFGYYTNGSQIEKRILILISNDGISYDSKFYLDYKNQ
ncbi:hypothetical protein [Flavivirga rizhaonensis]|uniref:Uncharacterized protein n=1 Tax=Flavivirga rizhaonensis TaxID=2559571 RepID=A0A4S1DWS5_9FLAO|nr:hypothetical protein [Flavivirga rizhaonensis]TGV02577.1 hypothetical protein EM932_10395 [Flavivirga rizhaonensis]